MFIIYGTKGVASDVGMSHFACPGCAGVERTLIRKSVRRYFTLFFIPLIPLDRLGEYLECGHCGGQYDERVLTEHPAVSEERNQAAFIEHLKRISVYTALADGQVNPAETDMIRAIYRDRSGVTLSQSDVEQELNLARLGRRGLSNYPRLFKGELDDDARYEVIQTILAVANADGPLGDEERRFLGEVAQEMGLSQADLSQIIAGGPVH